MKVLLAHNYYGSAAPSGENVVVSAERELLGARGHEVFEFARYSDDIRRQGLLGQVKGGISTPWNLSAARSIRAQIAENKPDVVHAHNTFPLISPSIFHAIAYRAARVLTLHNFRLFCPAGIPMRAGRACIDCLEQKSITPALKHGCYRNSRIATLPIAAGVALHRTLNTWTKQVDAFIALTEFQKQVMIDAGLPADLVHVKPNFYPGKPVPVEWSKRRASVVFAGRLTAEKGVEALVNAWLRWGAAAPELRIVGDGQLRQKLEASAAAFPSTNIRFLGQLSSEAAQTEIAMARLVVLPSEWFEGFPMVVREAFAFGTPAAVSNIGALPSIVQHEENGLVFEPGNEKSLLKTVRGVWDDAHRLRRLGEGARRSFETLYTEDANYRTLLGIYDEAIEVNRRRRDAAK